MVFWNPSTGVELVLHVDDFLVVGEEQALQDLKEKLQAVYELKATIIGEGKADRKGRNLSRSYYWLAGVGSGVGGQREACSGTVEMHRHGDVQARELAHDCRRAPQDCVAAAPRSQSTCRRTARTSVQQLVS